LFHIVWAPVWRKGAVRAVWFRLPPFLWGGLVRIKEFKTMMISSRFSINGMEVKRGW